MSRVLFKPVSASLARELISATAGRSIGKSIDIDGQSYTLDHVSRSNHRLFKSRGISIYWRVGRSVIRISDHWSTSRHFSKSDKLNCGSISGKYWDIANRPVHAFESYYLAGKYPFRMIAGVAGLTVLNRSCDHWKGK